MKYENAGDILPAELLKELQKYAAGKLLYVPSGDEKKAWGAASGYREQLLRRNVMIRNKYAHGLTVSELADEYYLSLDSIKKIIYTKNGDTHLPYAPTLTSAVHYANTGMLEEWVHCYWRLTRNADPAEQGFIQGTSLYFGIIRFPLRLIERHPAESGRGGAGATGGGSGLGAEASDGDNVETGVGGGTRVTGAGEPSAAYPPLLVQYEDGKFYCTIQPDLLATLRSGKINAFPTIIMVKENAAYKRFMKHYGNIFIYVDQV